MPEIHSTTEPPRLLHLEPISQTDRDTTVETGHPVTTEVLCHPQAHPGRYCMNSIEFDNLCIFVVGDAVAQCVILFILRNRKGRQRSRSPRRRSRSNSRDRQSSRYNSGGGGGRGAVSGSSLLAELSKFQKGREVVLKKEQQGDQRGK